MSAALDVLADEGLARLNVDALATRAGSGKAAIYRRWSSIPVLLEQAVQDLRLISLPADQGSLRADLFALLHPWTAVTLGRDHRAAAALFSAAHVHQEVRRALMAAIVTPLRQSLETVIERGHARGEHLTETRGQLTIKLVQAVWWERGVSFADPMTPGDLWSLIDDAFLPVDLGTRAD